MKVLINYLKEECYLSVEQQDHIIQRHPEATIELISTCLSNPIEIRKSSSNKTAHLYYLIKTKQRFFCVILKICKDGNYISTAYTTSKMKHGEIVYKKEN